MAYTIQGCRIIVWRWCYKWREIDYFFAFCSTCKDGRQKPRYEIYRLWARLLRHRRISYKKHGRFDFHNDLKWYLRDVAKGEFVDDDPHLR